MKLNKLLAAVLVAAFALPVMAQNGPGPAPGAHGPVHKKHHVKKHKKHKKHHHVKKHNM